MSGAPERLLDAGVAGGAEPSLEGFRLSPQQCRLWTLAAEGDPAGFKVMRLVRWSGALDGDAVEAALAAAVRRHEILRTTFRRSPGMRMPLQVIAAEGALPLVRHDLGRLAEPDRRAALAAAWARVREAPVDPAAGPLGTAELFRCGPEDHRLLLGLHALTADPASVDLVLDEVARAVGGAAPDGEPMQYADVAEWLHELLAAPEAEPARRFWPDAGRAGLAACRLPPPGRRPAAGPPGAFAPRSLGGRLEEAVPQLAARLDATPAELLLAAWSALALRLTGRPEVVIGTVFGGRRSPELARAIGPFARHLPLVLGGGGEGSFAGWVETVRRAHREALARQEYFDWSDPGGGAEDGRAGAFALAFDGGETAGDLPAGLAEERRADCIDRFELRLALQRPAAGPAVRLDYDAARWDAEAAAVLLERLAALLRGAAARPEAALPELPLLGPAEHRRVMIDFNRSARPLPDRPVHRRFEARAAAHPEATAVACGGRRISYRELDREANRLARRLRRRGLGPEAVVALFAERSPAALVGILGTLKAGACYLPIDPGLPAERIAFLLADSGARVVLTDVAARAALPGTALEILELDLESGAAPGSGGDGSPLPPGLVDRRLDSLAYVIYTSGSTGRPKGVQVHHGALAAYLDWAVTEYLADGGRALVHSPLGFDLTVTALLAPLLAGGTVELVPPAAGLEPLAEALAAGGEVALLKLTPSHLAGLALLLDPAAARRVRVLVVGGEALLGEALEPWRRHAPETLVVNEYGPTETVVGCCRSTLRAAAVPATGAVSIGRPAPNCRLYVLGRNGRPAPEGVAGELHIGGAQVARGYRGRPGLTAERFVPDPYTAEAGARLYRTGDLAVHRADGLEYVGRGDEQLKIRGHRVEPGEIEAVLCEHPGVRAAAVVDRPRDDRGPGLAAFFVPAAEPAPAAAELRRFLAERLPEPLLPASFAPLPSLPLTARGKVDRRALRQLDPGRAAAGRYEAPASEPERRLAEIWRRLLGVERIGVHDSFFALGGDSILSIQAVARMNRAGFRVTPRQMFEHQTIAELLGRASGAGAAEPAAGAAAGSGPLPLTPIQHAFFEQRLADPHHFNQTLFLRARAPLAPALLAPAVAAVVARHDALRLRFQPAPGGWRQECAAPGGPAPFTAIDCSALPAGRRRAAIEAAAAAVQASLDLAAGPLLRAARIGPAADGEARLLLAVHHLAIDAVSWWVLLADLQAVYAAADAGRAVRLGPPPVPFRRWAGALAAAARSPRLAGQRSRWVEAIGGGGPRLPLARPSAANRVADVASVEVALEPAETEELLRQAPRPYRNRIDEVLLAAVGEALCAWTGGDRVLIDLEGHGREEELAPGIDLSRTVGWFTCVYPVLLRMPRAGGPGAALIAAKEALRGLPAPRAGFGVLRHLGDEPARAALADLPRPEVVFNYLGQLDRALGESSLLVPAAESPGPSRSARQRRGHALEIEAAVVGGRLTASFRYSAAQADAADLEAVAAAFAARLRAYLAHCRSPAAGAWTPSDFPLAGISAGALARLAAVQPGLEDLYPLSPAQEGMLFESLLEPRSGVYCERLTGVLAGDLDAGAFTAAWRRLVARHAVLRSGFHWDAADRPLQRVDREAEPPISWHDWRDLDAGARRERFAQLVDADRSRPFDLATPPLMRLALAREAPDRHRFLWSHHHLLLDGWSTGRVFVELLELYRAARAGREDPLPAARPYREFIAWLEGRAGDGEEEFWRRVLAGFGRPTPLPAARPAPGPDAGGGAADGERFADRLLELPAAATAALRARMQRASLTLNTALLAAWAVVLGRHGGGDDVVFGATVAGRPPDLEGVETMVGVFINTLPVRLRVDAARPADEWLQRVQREIAALREHEQTPLARIQGWSEVAAGSPLFETLVVFENYPLDELLRPADGGAGGDPAGLRMIEVRPLENTHYPLTLVAAPGERLALRLLYDRERVDAVAAARALGHLGVVLEALARDGGRPPAELPILSAGERQQLVAEWNDTATARAGGALHLRFAARAAARPDAVTAEGDGGRALTYGELERRADRLARRLRRLGIGADQRVAVGLDAGFELLIAVLGLLKAGAAYVPLDPAYPPARQAFMLADSGARVLITRGDLAGRLPAGVPRLLLDREPPAPARRPPAPPPAAVAPDGLAYVLYTSGSTGRPKGVAMSHRALDNLVRWQVGRWGERAAARTLLFASPSFDVSFQEMFATWAAGGTLVTVAPEVRRDPAALAAWLDRARVERLLVPFVALAQLAAAAAEGAPPPAALASVITAGEQLQSTRELRRLFAALPASASLVNQYGPTEAHVVSAWDLPADSARWPPLPPIGRPIANVRLLALDGRLRAAPAGVEAELYIGGEALARGYLGRPAQTAARFVPDPTAAAPGARLYRTGDLVRQRPDGAFDYLGRADDQVKVSGYRIEPGEVELALAEHPAVRAAVVAPRDGAAGPHLVAFVQPQPGAAAPERELRAHLEARLPAYMVPSRFVALAELPLTPSGKVDRRRLPAADAASAPAAASRPPAGGVEELLAALWAELLGRPAVARDDDFFALGGHSLLATRLVSRVRRAFGVELPIRSLFEAPTVRALARRIEAARAGAPALPPIERRREAGPAPLGAGQRRLWFLDRLAPGGAAYNIPAAVRLGGPLAPGALRRALFRLLARHQALRTRCGEIDGRPVQWIDPPSAARLLPRIDLAALPAPRRAAELSRLAAAEARRPFDLARGGPFRALLAALAAEEHALLLTMHHIVSDGWSMGILVRDLTELYRSEREGSPPRLPELPVQFADVAAWQERRLTAEALGEQLDYWRRRLAGAPDRLRLGGEPPPGAGRGARSGRVAFELGAEVAGALVALARRRGATLYMALLALFQVFLHHLTGRTDLLVGSPVAGRRREETEELIGFFVNTLVMRGDLAGDPTFGELLERARETALAAYAHQDLPFEEVVKALAPDRFLSRSPLFQVWFVLQNAPRPEPRVAGLEIEVIPVHNGGARHDLVLDLVERDGGLLGTFEYRRDRIGAVQAGRYPALFAALAEAAAADPELRLGALVQGLERRGEELRRSDRQRFREERRSELVGLFRPARGSAGPAAAAPGRRG